MSSSLARSAATFAVALLLGLAACGESTATGPDPVTPVASVRVASPGGTMLVEQVAQLHATPVSSSGRVLEGRVVTWSSANPERATITADGVATAISEGPVTFTATSEGVSGSLVVTVLPIPATNIALVAPTQSMEVGESQQLAVTVSDSRGRPLNDRPVTWQSEAPAVATVSPAGLVTAVGAGTVRIVAQHGTLSVGVNVTVTATVGFTADLLFDAYAAGETGPRLFVSDPLSGVATLLLAHPGASDAVASPDGSRIAFTCTSDQLSICTAAADGSDIRVLTSGELFNEDQPAWSPDGTRIAFRRWAHGGPAGQPNPTDVWVMNADGSAQANVTNDALVQHSPSWSPVPIAGSYRLAFAQERLSEEGYVLAQLFTVRLDGTGRSALSAAGAWADSDPTWSPDGSTVAFTRLGSEYDGELRLVDVASRQERALLAQTLADAQRHPAWSPDGHYLAFTSLHEPSPTGNWRRQLYTVRADGSDLVRRTTSDIDKENTAWLPRR